MSQLSGVAFVQAIVYFKLYSSDTPVLKVMVLVVWSLDAIHSTCLVAALFVYFVTFRGDDSKIDYIPWSIAFSVVVTAIQTLIAHCFFSHKIFKSSNRNYYVTTPIIVLALARVGAATVTTSEMSVHWALRFERLLYLLLPGCAFNTILLLPENIPDLAATASLICWLLMPHNLIFLGLHFIIEKLYANSLLASLNTRKALRQMGPRLSPWSDTSLPVLSFEDFPPSVPPRNPLNLMNPADMDYLSRAKSRKVVLLYFIRGFWLSQDC
ncbi:hypothetical protein VNI00_004444 [Paramarasmius palmivorus]|uniref:DUF6534 domain-containing protein n=1 Tax=Paramarasmius palmivorus TaxID=297713 RepID=A0AAW0DHQ4_9AGAR